MVGRTVEDLYPRSIRKQGEVILKTDHLAGRIKPRSASFALHRGEVVGIAGLVGAGRTELLRALFGMDKIKRGEVRLSAYVGAASPAARWDQGMGIVSEDRKTEGLALSLSIGNNPSIGGPRRPQRRRPAHGHQWRRDVQRPVDQQDRHRLHPRR